MTKKTPNKKYLSTPEAAEHIGYSAITLARWRKQYKGPRYTHPNGDPNEYRYSVADLDAFMESNMVEPEKTDETADS